MIKIELTYWNFEEIKLSLARLMLVLIDCESLETPFFVKIKKKISNETLDADGLMNHFEIHLCDH